MLFSVVAVLFHSPTSGAPGFQFLHQHVLFSVVLKYNSYSNGCAEVSYCGFYLHLPDD